MTNSFSKDDKIIVYSLLTKVMDADNIQDPKEQEFLNEIKDRFSLDPSDIKKADAMSLNKCKKELSKFSDPKRQIIKELLISMANADGRYVKQEEDLINSLQLDISHFELELIADWRDADHEIVGYYSKFKDGRYGFNDICSPDFSERTYKNGDEIIIYTGEIPALEENNYYQFHWSIELNDSERGFQIIPKDNIFIKVQPKELVDRLYSMLEKSPSGVINQLSRIQTMVNTQLTASSDGTFIYELLQNANDYPVKHGDQIELVDVEFYLTDNYLIYRHTGREFSPRNIAAISKISAGEKKKEKNAIGYKGIGFKTVFSENDYVYLESGDYTVRFDEAITQESRSFPWQIMPIWTEKSEIDDEVKVVMANNRNFRVQMAIRPNNSSKLQDDEKSYEFIFNDIFKDEKDILFIPNIRSVRVFYNGIEQICRTKDVSKWALTQEPLVYRFTQEEIDENNREIVANKRIPEKYKDFEDTRVSFACQRNERKLLPVEDAKIYCYLPTQVSLGFPFLMNTDMIPTGPRDAFETKIAFNHKIMRIAGSKFVEWINQLLMSNEYDMRSVFSILPDLDNKVENYEDFIEDFNEGFDEAIKTTAIVPTWGEEYEKVENCELVSNIVFDKTGLTSSDIYVMYDEEFLEFAGLSEYTLPHPILRKDKRFNSFLKRYVSKEQIFDVDQLKDFIHTEGFQEWIRVQKNNNKFLHFLLEKGYLKDFFNEDIFLEADGDLFKAKELFYDVDEYLDDLQAFSRHICYLSPATREYFALYQEWDVAIASAFAEFDCNKFVSKLLSEENLAETQDRLCDLDTSLHFYNFLAEYVDYQDNFQSLPFFNDDDECVDAFNSHINFFSSDHGHEVYKKEWLSYGIGFEFVSTKYQPKTLEYFKEHFGVVNFSDEFVIKNIILNDEFKGNIADGIQDCFELSKDFVYYCFANSDFISPGGLSKYALAVIDIDGEEAWNLTENHIYFESGLYDELSSKEWIKRDWMYSLDENYFSDEVDEKALRTFFREKFYVETFTEKRFYQDVVKYKLAEILSLISGQQDLDGHKNIDFVQYLDRSYHLIFEEERDDNIFGDLTLVTDDIHDVEVDKENLYIYDREAKEIISHSWFPDDTVQLCHPDYGNSKALKAIGVKTFEFREFYDDVIVQSLDSINDTIESKAQSIEFHQFIIDHLSKLTPEQQSKMTGAKVYLYGQEDPADKAGGHKILSAKARELFENGLVEFSDLDLIDREYNTEANSNYWETVLGNTKFTVNHFFSWLKENVETFSETLQDKTLNIVFWRWLKINKVVDTFVKEALSLPVLLKNGAIVNSDATIYFSDEYLDGAGIEHYLGSFDKNAYFISPEFIAEGEDIQEWKTFWGKVGVKYAIVDILHDTIIPHLDETYDESLPKLLAQYREDLNKRYQEEDGSDLISHLTALNVRAHDGNFYKINEVIYVNCGNEEPFPYVKLPNQIFATAEERLLIINAIENAGGELIENLAQWRQRKINCYLELQKDDIEAARVLHFQLINDLSSIRNEELNTFNSLERIDEIKILNRENEFCDPTTLTMGSVYKPFFDFELCGVESLEYVSDAYRTECKEYVGRLFRSLKVHHNFQEDDIDYLTNRRCALYFWETYLLKKDTSKTHFSYIIELIEDHKFDDIACIPAKDKMKRPYDLYYGEQVKKFVEKIEDWENKVPSIKDIKLNDDKTIFQKLPFKHSLDFLDALYALIYIKGQDRRVTLLTWMIEKYDESYDEKIRQYRDDENALWINCKNNPVQIKELYALDYYNDKTLDQYFGNNPRIINREYLPRSESFTKACDILGIDIITADDLKMEPMGDTEFNARTRTHKLFALAFAGNIDRDNWKELYDEYCEKLNSLTLHRCESILITYTKDTEINQALKQFYHKQGDNDFYFVKSLDDKLVYGSYVEAFLNYLGIKKEQLSFDKAKIIMSDEQSALDDIEDHNALLLDDQFMDELNKLIPGIKRELVGNVADDEDEEAGAYRPTFITIERSETSEDEGKEDEETSYNDYDKKDDEPFENDDDDEYVIDKDLERNDDYQHHSDEGTSHTYAPSETPSQSKTHPTDNYVEPDKNDNGQSRKEPSTSVRIDQSTFSGTTSQPSQRTNSHEQESNESENTNKVSDDLDVYSYDPDQGDLMGSVSHDRDYEPLGSTPRTPRRRRWKPRQTSIEELERLRSRGTPLELESLPATDEEIDILEQQCGISPEQIADTNYLAQLRLYQHLVEQGEEPEESMKDFVENADDVTLHKLKGGKYIHACSAARGVMYISPSVWNKIVDNKCIVCVYLDGRGKNFKYIDSPEKFLSLVEKDDVVIKITGKEKVDVVRALYSGLLKGKRGTAYTLIRVASRTNMDAVFAHYVGAMAEADDGNDDNEY